MTTAADDNTWIIQGEKLATMLLDPDTKADSGAIIIRNPHVAAAQRNQFDYIWSVSRAAKTSSASVRYE
jgi:hypothetical protein